MFLEEESLCSEKLFRAAYHEVVLFSELVLVGFVLKSFEEQGCLQKGQLLFAVCRYCSVVVIRGWTVLGGEQKIGVTTFGLFFDVKPCREKL